MKAPQSLCAPVRRCCRSPAAKPLETAQQPDEGRSQNDRKKTDDYGGGGGTHGWVTLVSRVELLTRAECGLCDEALPRVRLISRLLGRRLEVVDIAEDPHLEREFDLRIPILRNERGDVLAEGPIGWKQAYRAVRRT